MDLLDTTRATAGTAPRARRLALLAGIAAGLALSLTAARAATETIKADLTSAAETPPNSSKGSGTLTGSYDPATRKLSYDVTYSGLTGPATMAHFHGPAPVGKAAGVEVPLKGPLASPIKGEVTLTPEQAKTLADGMTYVNIHTAANKGGEIRGQVMLEK